MDRLPDTTPAPPPLAGVRVVELAGLGPVPFAAMLLAGLGADVVRIARPGDGVGGDGAIDRGRRVVELDLRTRAGGAAALDLAAGADVLLEGFRPGVLERLGLDPASLHARNPALVVGRMSAWGQTGPMARVPAHDINILALAGLLAAIGPAERPAVPLNLVADYGGGALYLVMAALAALLAARASGIGRVLDCAMADGVASLLTLHADMRGSGRAVAAREANLLDGGAPFYTTYACADGGFMAVGAIEPRFYAELLRVTALGDDPLLADQHDRAAWPAMKARLAATFAGRPRQAWTAAFDGVEACVTPVLDLAEAPHRSPAPSRPSAMADVATIVADWSAAAPITPALQGSR